MSLSKPSATRVFKPTSPLTVRKKSVDMSGSASSVTAVKTPLKLNITGIPPPSSPPRTDKINVGRSRIATSGRKMAKRLSLSFA
jgi:hypothetical protein